MKTIRYSWQEVCDVFWLVEFGVRGGSELLFICTLEELILVGNLFSLEIDGKGLLVALTYKAK